MGLLVEQYFIYNIDGGGSRQRDAVGSMPGSGVVGGKIATMTS
jgi:hypothetical protein